MVSSLFKVKFSFKISFFSLYKLPHKILNVGYIINLNNNTFSYYIYNINFVFVTATYNINIFNKYFTSEYVLLVKF